VELLTRDQFREAVFARDKGRCVICGAEGKDAHHIMERSLFDDGGYYLLGLKTAQRRLFEDIAWSTERVAIQTLERAREVGLGMHLLPAWYDVDDLQGLRRLHRELTTMPAPDSTLARQMTYYPAATAALLGSLPLGELTGGRETDPQISIASA